MPDKILTHFIRHLSPSDWSPQRIAEQWRDGFHVNAERINEKRKMKIKNEEDYQSRLVGVATKKYRNMVHPDFVSRAGLDANDIITKHSANLSRSYKKYQSKIDAAYETVDGIPAKRFKDAVDHSKENYARGMAARTLMFTGTRAEGLGIAPLVALWLTADSIVEGILQSSDKLIAGNPFCLTKLRRKGSFKAAINQRIIQAGSAIVKSAYGQDIIKVQNDETNEMVQGFVDPALNLYPFETGGKSFINFANDPVKLFYLEMKVTQK
ncbi:MAG: hypothetical protein HY811_03800 [Planctomycetes bacterium]|nr:hypothetical protein [Planctomycetota bacterium]